MILKIIYFIYLSFILLIASCAILLQKNIVDKNIVDKNIVDKNIVDKNIVENFIDNNVHTNINFFFEKAFNSNIYYKGNFDYSKNKIDIVVCNHLSILDWLVCYSLINKTKDKPLHIVHKKSLFSLPILGTILKNQNNIALDRNYSKDKSVIINFLNNLDKGIILLYPEGTRITKKKMKESIEYSNSNNKHVFDKCLYPRTKGYNLITKVLKKKNKLGNIIDLTIRTDNFNNIHSLKHIFKNHIGNFYVDIENYNETDTELISIWKQKDDKLKQKLNKKLYKKYFNKFHLMYFFVVLSIVVLTFILIYKKYYNLLLGFSVINLILNYQM
uniref:Acyltransferase n=1 Tax=Megaviridae environmental sample TaxID=1737588 RepID=A0A5J6VJG5_9VIRU|nr:MAG: acyltransferase [Megaviridae environmental sample]